MSIFSHNVILINITLNIDWLWFQKYLSNLVNLIWSNPKLASLILEGMVQEVVIIFPMPNKKKRKHRVGTCHVESSLKRKRNKDITNYLRQKNLLWYTLRQNSHFWSQNSNLLRIFGVKIHNYNLSLKFQIFCKKIEIFKIFSICRFLANLHLKINNKNKKIWNFGAKIQSVLTHNSDKTMCMHCKVPKCSHRKGREVRNSNLKIRKQILRIPTSVQKLNISTCKRKKFCIGLLLESTQGAKGAFSYLHAQ